MAEAFGVPGLGVNVNPDAWIFDGNLTRRERAAIAHAVNTHDAREDALREARSRLVQLNDIGCNECGDSLCPTCFFKWGEAMMGVPKIIHDCAQALNGETHA